MNYLKLNKLIIIIVSCFFSSQGFSIAPQLTKVKIEVEQQKKDDSKSFKKMWSCGFRAIFNATQICRHLLENESVANITLHGKKIKKEYQTWERDDAWKIEFYASKYGTGSECFERGTWLDIHDIRSYFKFKADENSIDFSLMQPIVIGAPDIKNNSLQKFDSFRFNEKVKNFRESESGHLVVILNPKNHYIVYVFEKKDGNCVVYKFESIDGYRNTSYERLVKFIFTDELTIKPKKNKASVIDVEDLDSEVVELSHGEEAPDVERGTRSKAKRRKEFVVIE